MYDLSKSDWLNDPARGEFVTPFTETKAHLLENDRSERTCDETSASPTPSWTLSRPHPCFKGQLRDLARLLRRSTDRSR